MQNLRSTYLVFLPFFLLLTAQCGDKDKPPFDVSISGILFDSCGGSPLAHTTLELWDPGHAGNWLYESISPEQLASTSTDENGKFRLDFHQGLTGGYGNIRFENNLICQGYFNLFNHNESFDVGEIYTVPFRKKTNYRFKNLRDWRGGESVIASFSRGNVSYRDTFNSTNTAISGTLMYASGYTYSTTKVIHNGTYDNVDTVSSYGTMRFKWNTKKHKGTETHYIHVRECDTSALSLYIDSDL